MTPLLAVLALTVAGPAPQRQSLALAEVAEERVRGVEPERVERLLRKRLAQLKAARWEGATDTADLLAELRECTVVVTSRVTSKAGRDGHKVQNPKRLPMTEGETSVGVLSRPEVRVRLVLRVSAGEQFHDLEFLDRDANLTEAIDDVADKLERWLANDGAMDSPSAVPSTEPSRWVSAQPATR
jgi:hypothetical protein